MNLLSSQPFFLKKLSLFWILFGIALGLRLWAVISIPVIDPSEARYAEIARKMWELKDWITPYHDYGVPFWAKPPLSTWMSALGMGLFGVNEFGGRFPLLLVSLIIIGMVMHFAASQNNKQLPLLSALILFTSPLFYVASAAIMTDIPLLCGMTLSMIAFWRVFQSEGSPLWGYGFFVGQAIGLLAKGPLCLVLTGMPLFFWLIATHQFKLLWSKLPWISGTLLMISLAAPWYILAERKTPGFLDYFVIGEHFSRFLVKGWDGDLYGNAHPKQLGTIWIYWLGATFPWSLWFLGLSFQYRHSLKKRFFQDPLSLYLVLWMLSPLCFFTLSRNIIWTYALPALPPFALLLGHLITCEKDFPLWQKRGFVFSTLLTPLVALGLCVGSFYNPEILNNQKRLVQDFRLNHPNASLAYFCHNCYSPTFYAPHHVSILREPHELNEFLKTENTFLAVKNRKLQDIPPPLRASLIEVAHYGDFILFENRHVR